MTLFLSGQGDEETWGYNIALSKTLWLEALTKHLLKMH